MEFKFLLRLLLKFRATLPLLGGAVAWASMYLFAWWLAMPVALIAQVAGPVGLAGAVIGWMIDIGFGVTTRLYRDHFQRRSDLAGVLYESGQIAPEDALNLHFGAALELTVAQEAALLAPRHAKKRLQRRRWVIENVLPLAWGCSAFTEPTNFHEWKNLVDELVDTYVGVEAELSFRDRIFGNRAAIAKRVVNDWQNRRVARRAAIRVLQPHRVVGLLSAPSKPLIDLLASDENPIPAEIVR